MTNGSLCAAYHSALPFTADGCVKSMHTSDPLCGYSALTRSASSSRASVPYSLTVTAGPPQPSSTTTSPPSFSSANGASVTPGRLRHTAAISRPIAPRSPFIITATEPAADSSMMLRGERAAGCVARRGAVDAEARSALTDTRAARPRSAMRRRRSVRVDVGRGRLFTRRRRAFTPSSRAPRSSFALIMPSRAYLESSNVNYYYTIVGWSCRFTV